MSEATWFGSCGGAAQKQDWMGQNGQKREEGGGVM